MKRASTMNDIFNVEIREWYKTTKSMNLEQKYLWIFESKINWFPKKSHLAHKKNMQCEHLFLSQTKIIDFQHDIYTDIWHFHRLWVCVL